MKNFRFRVLLAAAWLASASAWAQTSASLTGTVLHDEQPLPGVTVTVSSPALQGTRSAVTGEAGVYFFSALPPGDYSVTFDMEGMQSVTERVRLSLAQTSRVDARMRLGTIAEAITITASAPAVIESTQVGTNVTTEMLDKLPVGRTIAAAVLMAPGVSTSGIGGGPSIAGAPSYDNMYLVNGVVVGENVRGQPHNLFIEDAIQETTILTGGISAEYGRFTGGVVNTITKSGGNEFSGSFRDNLTNPAWRKKTPWPTEADHIDDISEIYEATLGGRVIRDRLWFFAAGRLRETEEQLFTNVTNVPFVRGREETRLEGKLTGQLTPKHSLVGSYIDITDDLTNDFQFLIMDTSSLINRSLPNSLMSVLYSGVLTQNLLIEANYSEKEFAFIGSGSRFRDRVFGTLLVDSGNTNRRYWTSTFCGVCTNEKRDNNAWLAKATYFLSTRGLGSHNITGGVEDFTEIRIANNHQSGSDFRIIGPVVRDGDNVLPRFDATSIIQWNPIFTFSEGTDLGTMGVFVNDKWDLNNHWSFNLGLRFDQNDAKDADGHVISDDSEISPRLGIQFDIFGDGRHKINANYGRYVTKITEGNVAGHGQAAGVSSAFQWRYAGPVVNGAGAPPVSTEQALQSLWNWFDSVGGTSNKEFLIFAAQSGLSGRIEQPISSPSADELTVGYAVQIGRNAFLRTDVVAREWNNFYAQRIDQSTPKVTDQFGNVGDVALLENDDSLEREYFGVLMQGQWRPGRAYLGGSYTYSELKGNDEGEFATTATSPNTPLEIFYPEFLSYAQRRPSGWLPEDVRHRARGWIGYELPIPVIGRVNASLLHTFETGAPYSAIGFIDATGRSTGTAYEGLPANPGYTLSQAGTQHRYFFSDRGEFRTDDYNRTDFALNYALPVAGLEFFVQALVTNIFDNDGIVGSFVEGAAGGIVALTGPDTTVFTRRTSATRGLSAFNPFTQTPIECPQGALAPTCQSMGAHWQKGENFGKANGTSSYQLPLSYAFTAGIRF